jgi:hypothetical protein
MAKDTENKIDPAAVDGATPEAKPMSNKDKWRSRYSDIADEDEDGLYGRANSNLDELDGYRKNNEALVSAMGKNKALAAMLSAAKDGQDPFLWLSENLGADISELVQNPDYAKKLSEAAQKFVQAQTDGETRTKATQDNWTKSFNDLKAAQQDLGLSDDEAYQLASDVLTFAQNVYNGQVSVEDFKRFRDGGRYDKDVSAAREEGAVAGRNERISDDLRKPAPEGIPPTLPTGGGEKIDKKPKKSSFFSGVK